MAPNECEFQTLDSIAAGGLHKIIYFSPCANSCFCPLTWPACLCPCCRGTRADFRHRFHSAAQARQRETRARVISSPSFTKTNKSSVFSLAIDAATQSITSAYLITAWRAWFRRLIELYNIFISAEFVLLLDCGLVTYFSASLASTSSFKPWAVQGEREREGVQTCEPHNKGRKFALKQKLGPVAKALNSAGSYSSSVFHASCWCWEVKEHGAVMEA